MARTDILLVRSGKIVESIYVRKGEVAQIPQRDGSTISVFGSEFVSQGVLAPRRREFSCEVMRFGSDGKQRMCLDTDAAGRKVSSALVEKGRTLEFPVKRGATVSVLIEAGQGDPPNPPAQLFDGVGPAKRGDRIILRTR